MTRDSLKLGRWTACVLASAALVLGACDQDLPQFVDASVDTSADLFVDMGTDPAVDTAEDPTVDTVEDDGSTSCTFPTGPYGFSAVGNTVGPMAWPSAVAGMDELLAADLNALHCDPSVNSIFVQIVATS
jgi:hypothetical protein